MLRWPLFRQKKNAPTPDVGRPLVDERSVPFDAHKSSRASPTDPKLARQYFELSCNALAASRIEEAEHQLRLALAAQPDHFEALCNLGALLRDRGQLPEAAAFIQRALDMKPRTPAAAFNLGLIRINQGRWSEAVSLLEVASSCQPKDADTHYWLGNARMGYGDAIGARSAYRSALRCKPGLLEARWGLTMAQIPAMALTDAEQAAGPQNFAIELKRLTAWIAANPTSDGSNAVGAQQPYYLAYREDNHINSLKTYGELCTAIMAKWSRQTDLPAPTIAKRKKWRIGIVSAHVHSHAVWHALLRGWIEHLDPSKFELHVFHTGQVLDAETEWAKRRVAKLTHGPKDWKDWVQLVSNSQFDALLYPEIGMDATTMRLAALRLARLQLAGWGHPMTSGLPTMDGYISADAFEPPDANTHYTEKLIKLPRLGSCYYPYGTAPAKIDFSEFGISAGNRVLLFAGTAFKYAPSFDATLVDIARRCAPCKFVFFRDGTRSLADQLQNRLSTALREAGVDPKDILCFVPWQSQAGFFAFLDRADVFVDSLGFSGFNTVMQAVERSTPIVAYQGRYMRGRFASGVLHELGLNECVCASTGEFVRCIDRVVADDTNRSAIRQRIAANSRKLYADKTSVTELGNYIENMLQGT